MIREANAGWCTLWVSRVWEVGLRLSLGQLLETRPLSVRAVDVQAASSTCLKQEWTQPAVVSLCFGRAAGTRDAG